MHASIHTAHAILQDIGHRLQVDSEQDDLVNVVDLYNKQSQSSYETIASKLRDRSLRPEAWPDVHTDKEELRMREAVQDGLLALAKETLDFFVPTKVQSDMVVLKYWGAVESVINVSAPSG